MAQKPKAKDLETSVIEDLERKVTTLTYGKQKLKQALTILEEQVQTFEALFSKQNEEITKLREIRSSYEATNTKLIDGLRQAKGEINGGISMKLMLEKKIAVTESTLNRIEVDKEAHISQLQDQISNLMISKENLSQQIKAINPRLSEVEESNAHLIEVVEELRTEAEDLKEDNSKILNQYVRLKTHTSELEEELDESRQHNEEQEQRIVSLKMEVSLLESEMKESQFRHETTIAQQNKLIDHLKHENELLLLNSKKKRTLADRFFGRENEKENSNP